jgi:hypothetical protein
MMSLHVICPGCLKRFQVSARFAGRQGPCPNCGPILTIPKESVTMHGADETESEKAKKRKLALRPISHLDLELDPIRAGRYALGVLGVLLLAFLLGCIPMGTVLRSFLGVLGLCLVAFPLTLFGYKVIRDQEQIFFLTGEDLYRRAGIVAAGYVILWLGFEVFLTAIPAGAFVSVLYFTAFAVLATLLVHPLLEMEMWNAFLHCCIFCFAVVLLRFFIGFGWFWASSGMVRYTVAPPPPFLPGM